MIDLGASPCEYVEDKTAGVLEGTVSAALATRPIEKKEKKCSKDDRSHTHR